MPLANPTWIVNAPSRPCVAKPGIALSRTGRSSTHQGVEILTNDVGEDAAIFGAIAAVGTYRNTSWPLAVPGKAGHRLRTAVRVDVFVEDEGQGRAPAGTSLIYPAPNKMIETIDLATSSQRRGLTCCSKNSLMPIGSLTW